MLLGAAMGGWIRLCAMQWRAIPEGLGAAIAWYLICSPLLMLVLESEGATRWSEPYAIVQCVGAIGVVIGATFAIPLFRLLKHVLSGRR
jgi:hypothetical protein